MTLSLRVFIPAFIYLLSIWCSQNLDVARWHYDNRSRHCRNLFMAFILWPFIEGGGYGMSAVLFSSVSQF
ncbi:MAG: hypothetical protein DRR19_02860 [Candidatus Parabeggiatoa sp. nov. 1]|nr:MAG: hypothetical protein DRR19_02860 [Gammaproteobacteria bacterium]